MHEYTQQKEQEISTTEACIEQFKQEYEPYKVQDDLNLLFSVFPHLNERLRIAQLYKGIGLRIDATKQLFMGEAVTVMGKLSSPKHNQSFNVQDAKLQLF